MLNTAAFMGRFTSDPELRTTKTGVSVASFTLAVDRDYIKQGEERQTDFIDIVAWRKTADFVCRYFHKGQLAAVQGSLQTRTYTDKEGAKRKAMEVLANSVYFAEPKKEPAPKSNLYRTDEPMEYAEVPTPDDDLPF